MTVRRRASVAASRTRSEPSPAPSDRSSPARATADGRRSTRPPALVPGSNDQTMSSSGMSTPANSRQRGARRAIDHQQPCRPPRSPRRPGRRGGTRSTSRGLRRRSERTPANVSRCRSRRLRSVPRRGPTSIRSPAACRPATRRGWGSGHRRRRPASAAPSAPESSSYGCTPSVLVGEVRRARRPASRCPLVPLSPGKRWASRNRSSSVNVPNSVDRVRGVSASR